MPNAFHEISFPHDIALGARGGPERRTDIVTTGSGREERNARWAHSRRTWDAGYGVKNVAALADVVAFFEERRGRLTGFRFRDPLDWRSSPPGATPAPGDQFLGAGDGVTATFQLQKAYGAAFAPYARPIRKPVPGSVRVAVAGVSRTVGVEVAVDATTGLVTFTAGFVPVSGAVVTAGFDFDVPVRFDEDRLDVDLSHFGAGAIPRIPLVEIVV